MANKQIKKPTRPVVRSSKSLVTSKTKSKPLWFVVIALFALIGVIFLRLSRAEDASIPVGITKTQYAYPANAIFVSPSGDNAKAGSITAPLKTLQAAVDKATAGSTIVMRAGTYRESLKTVAKALTIQPYPNEEVWLDGSDVVTGWVQDGSVWRKDDWTSAAALCPSNACYDPNFVTPENPAAGLPDMLFINGIQQKQVLNRSEVTTGTFYVDRANSKMYVGTNPSGKTTEASTRKRAIFFYSAATAGSKLRGIGVRRYASNLYFNSQPAQVEASNGASGIEFENMTFTQSSSQGLFLLGTSAKPAAGFSVKSSTFANNGASGMGGSYVDGMTMENNVYYSNNTEKAQWEGAYGSYAGVKLTYTTNSTVRNNLFQDNFGTGFWCDLDCRNVRVVGNMARGNTNNGLYYEVSYDGIIASNVSYNNGNNGIKASGRGIKIYNNTVLGNGSDNIFAYDDPTRFTSQNIEIMNNISASGTKSIAESRLIYAKMQDSTISQVVTAMDSNLYYRATASLPKYVLGWVGKGVTGNYTTLDATLRTQTGREAKSTLIENKAVTTLFKDSANGDFRLVAGSAAVNSSSPLPADVAATVGVSSGQIVNRGALTWKSGASNVLAVSTPDPVVPPTPPANKAPTASISTSGTSFTAPASFQVSASAADSDGTVTKIEILQNNAVIYSCYNAVTCSYPASNYSAGLFQYAARAYDNAVPIATGTSGTVTVIVSTPATPPVTVPTPTQPIQLSAPASISTIDGAQFNASPYRIPLQWPAVLGASGYKITGPGQRQYTVTGNTFVDSSVVPGYDYTYSVVATKDGAQSPAKSVTARVNCFLFVCWPSVVN